LSDRTYIAGTKQQVNGQAGEDRTAGLLGTHFWLLRRNVDIDGADFLVETTVGSLEEERVRRSGITATGIVQAKFFECGNSVRVRRDYAEDDGKPRAEFFLLAHTNGEQGVHHHFFLTARNLSDLPLSDDGKYRLFRVGRESNYECFRDIPPDQVAEVICSSLAQVERLNNARFLRRAFGYYRTAHLTTKPDIRCVYHLDRFRGAHIVTVKEEGHSSVRLIELRRDLFLYHGDFAWGYPGTGPQFLTVCLLAHHLGGEEPSRMQMMIILEMLISRLDKDQSHVITTADLEVLIGPRAATLSD